MSRLVPLAGLVAALPVLAALRPVDRTPAPHPGGACELRLADRARTPSQRCLACHDGSVATGGVRAVQDLGMPHDPGTANHPVDVDYGLSRLNRTGKLRPRAALPHDLPLVDGKIACTTCHDGASREPGKAALGGSSLCFACHAM